MLEGRGCKPEFVPFGRDFICSLNLSEKRPCDFCSKRNNCEDLECIVFDAWCRGSQFYLDLETQEEFDDFAQFIRAGNPLKEYPRCIVEAADGFTKKEVMEKIPGVTSQQLYKMRCRKQISFSLCRGEAIYHSLDEIRAIVWRPTHLITSKQLEEQTGVERRKIFNMVKAGKIKPVMTINRINYYEPDCLCGS